MANLAKYLVWLNWLASLAANSGPFIAALLEFYEKVKGFLPKIPEQTEAGGLSITQALTSGEGVLAQTQVKTAGGQTLVADVLEAEGKVLALCDPEAAGTLAVRDGSRLRELFAFLTMLREFLAGFGIGG